VQQHDFTTVVDVATGDELEMLANTFNHMVAELRTYASGLEDKVRVRTAELQETLDRLKVEEAKSEQLLLNLLPGAIAERLKQSQESIADSFASVTVMFADIVDFTHLSAGITPHGVVKLLNELFSAFDSLAEKHGVEKIKTIGDAYMAVSGLPQPRDDHAQTMANMALDMQTVVKRFNETSAHPISIRIGLHTGPVVAGVIGTRRFIYDLWGDTVNTASRMESHGLADAIQVTTATRQALGDDYDFEPRGTIHVKGKGSVPVWLLRGRHA
jgi:class 3 adenylate cyclase